MATPTINGTANGAAKPINKLLDTGYERQLLQVVTSQQQLLCHDLVTTASASEESQAVQVSTSHP